MSTTNSDSSMDFGLPTVPSGGPGRPAEHGVWLDGDVLACACPDCGAPMSIRLWLMVADCFRCGSSIELSEEQEQIALHLFREQEETKREVSQEAAAAILPTVLRKPKSTPRPAAQPETVQPETTQPTSPSTPTTPASPSAEPRGRPRRVAASHVHRGARAHVRDIYEKGGIAVLLAGLFRDLPAWLISLVIHLIAICLLAIWFDVPVDDSPTITLSTSLSADDLEGEQGEIEETLLDVFEFDDPGAIEIEGVIEEVGAPTKDEVVLDPVDVPLDVPDPVGNLPAVATRPSSQLTPAPVGRMFAGRDPTVRAQAVEFSGGTSATEAAVARALVFLARHQNKDGSWSLDRFANTPDCDASCRRGAGRTHSDTAGTAMGLLPFLGAGQTHLTGEHQDAVFRGVKWLVENQKENGDLRGVGNGRMYAHGQATIALCEAFALTGDDQLREPAQLALNFIVRAQHPAGGWRYRPGEPGDLSVVGWQLMALKSGQMAYLHVPRKTFELASLYLDQVQRDKIGGRYAYQRSRPPTEAMTAEGLLCRQYLGWPREHPGLKNGVDFLLEKHPPNANRPNIYYWYYATQVMHHYGGTSWERWNAEMRNTLVATQEKKGHSAGSWTPRGGHSSQGGRLYMTSLAACILEVYYRHMPIYSEDVLEGYE